MPQLFEGSESAQLFGVQKVTADLLMIAERASKDHLALSKEVLALSRMVKDLSEVVANLYGRIVDLEMEQARKGN